MCKTAQTKSQPLVMLVLMESMSSTTPAPGTCLLCHTVDNTVTRAGLDLGEYWRCQRCGQMWDSHRLEAATAYAQLRTARITV